MTITTILGSPRKKGNTAAILAAFESLIPTFNNTAISTPIKTTIRPQRMLRPGRSNSSAMDFTVNRLNIPATGVNGCLGCNACQRTGKAPGCVQKDAASEMLKTILDSDVIVYASPVYVWDFTAQMKALMDRHYCFVKWKCDAGQRYSLQDKPVLLLSTCGGEAERNADLIQEIFTREMNYLHCRVVGCYVVPNCTTPAKLGDTVSKTARHMAEDLLTTDIA